MCLASHQSTLIVAKEPLADTSILLAQTIQISPNGFRDGDMGDDKPPHSAKESLQINILSRIVPFNWALQNMS